MSERHAPGWDYRKPSAGRTARPWAWSQINGHPDLPQHIDGLCQSGFHGDCPQAPGPAPGEPGTCGCPCHHTGQTVLDLGGIT